MHASVQSFLVPAIAALGDTDVKASLRRVPLLTLVYHYVEHIASIRIMPEYMNAEMGQQLTVCRQGASHVHACISKANQILFGHLQVSLRGEGAPASHGVLLNASTGRTQMMR